jgi:hypothetical protein
MRAAARGVSSIYCRRSRIRRFSADRVAAAFHSLKGALLRALTSASRYRERAGSVPCMVLLVSALVLATSSLGFANTSIREILTYKPTPQGVSRTLAFSHADFAARRYCNPGPRLSLGSCSERPSLNSTRTRHRVLGAIPPTAPPAIRLFLRAGRRHGTNLAMQRPESRIPLMSGKTQALRRPISGRMPLGLPWSKGPPPDQFFGELSSDPSSSVPSGSPASTILFEVPPNIDARAFLFRKGKLQVWQRADFRRLKQV